MVVKYAELFKQSLFNLFTGQATIHDVCIAFLEFHHQDIHLRLDEEEELTHARLIRIETTLKKISDKLDQLSVDSSSFDLDEL